MYRDLVFCFSLFVFSISVAGPGNIFSCFSIVLWKESTIKNSSDKAQLNSLHYKTKRQIGAILHSEV